MHSLYVFKVIIIGDSMVGKTALTETFLSGGKQFPRSYNMTSDVNLSAKDIHIQGNAIELILYDSAGSPLYTDFLQKCWGDINAIFAVFDVTSENSFESLKNWIKIAKAVQEPPAIETLGNNSSPGIIFANKIDLEGRRVVSFEKGNSLATQLGFQYFEGSAKINVGVEDSFTYLAEELHKLILENSI